MTHALINASHNGSPHGPQHIASPRDTHGGLNFRERAMAGVTLDGTTFCAVDFTGADLTDSNLSECRFINCCFDDVNLEFACLAGSVFDECSFGQTRWDGADWNGAIFYNCDFGGGAKTAGVKQL